MSKAHRTYKSAEQKADENAIVAVFAFVAITLAVFSGMAGRDHAAVDHSSSKQAVQQVQAGK